MTPAARLDRPGELLANATSFPEKTAANRRRSFVLLLLVAVNTLAVLVAAGVVVFMPLMFFIGPPALLAGIILGTVAALLYLPILGWTWVKSGDIVLSAAAARPSSSLAAQTARDVAEEVAVAAGIPAPKVVFIDRTTPNALAAGRDAHDATLALTPSLVDALSRQQLQAVVAHETAHILNGDIRFKTFLSAILVRFDLVGRSMLQYQRGTTGPIDWLEVPLAALVRLGGALARHFGLAAARSRELMADYTAVRLTRDPLALAEALTILDRLNPSGFGSPSNPLGQLFVIDPQGDSARHAGHPPLDERLGQLQRLAEEMGAAD